MTAMSPATARLCTTRRASCTACRQRRWLISRKLPERELGVRPACGGHTPLSARDRLVSWLDPGSARFLNSAATIEDPLVFTGRVPHPVRRGTARAVTGLSAAVVTAAGTIGGQPLMGAVTDSAFPGGSRERRRGERSPRPRSTLSPGACHWCWSPRPGGPGMDVVREQLRIAAGEPLTLMQDTLTRNGAAVDCRINAGDLARGSAPCPAGRFRRTRRPLRPSGHPCLPRGSGEARLRLIASKNHCRGQDRGQALARLRRALRQLRMAGHGIRATAPLLAGVPDTPVFRAA